VKTFTLCVASLAAAGIICAVIAGDLERTNEAGVPRFVPAIFGSLALLLISAGFWRCRRGCARPLAGLYEVLAAAYATGAALGGRVGLQALLDVHLPVIAPLAIAAGAALYVLTRLARSGPSRAIRATAGASALSLLAVLAAIFAGPPSSAPAAAVLAAIIWASVASMTGLLLAALPRARVAERRST